MNTHEPLRLEGFDVPLRGRRILLVGSPESWLQRLAVLESEALYKGHNVLVIQETHKGTGREWPSLMRKRWDVIFRVRESFDAQMLATYCQNASKPTRICWVFPQQHNGQITAGGDIPRALWSRWANQDITLLGCSETGAIGGVEWECILFPLKAEQQLVDRVLVSRGGGSAGMASKIRDHLAEIASSGAALAWTNIEEKSTAGSLYWYDPSEGSAAAEERWSRREVAGVLASIAKWAENTN